MKVLFCDDRIYRDTKEYQQLYMERKAPAQTLYGALQLPENGIELQIMDYHHPKPFTSRIKSALYVTPKIIRQAKTCDAIFSISFRGLELLMILRRLHLFSKPIFVWQHAAFQPASETISDRIKTWMLGGIDEFFFFNKEIADEALKTGKIKKYSIIPYGADVDFYASEAKSKQTHKRLVFLSSGVENRDYQTLVAAFSDLPVELEIYTFPSNANHNYSQVLEGVKASNISIHIVEKPINPVELRSISVKADCIVISTLPLPHKYPCGLTSIVEAMALGKPIIATSNPWYGIDIEKEGIGYVVNNVAEWKKVIRNIIENPSMLYKMGERALFLAQDKYNIKNTGKLIAQEIIHYIQNAKK